MAHQRVRLTNVSLERARFSVHKPKGQLQASYAPGPLAAGMETDIKVSFTATEVGDFQTDLHVSSEVNVLSITVSAKVQPDDVPLETQDSMFTPDATKQSRIGSR